MKLQCVSLLFRGTILIVSAQCAPSACAVPKVGHFQEANGHKAQFLFIIPKYDGYIGLLAYGLCA